ncbi:hypothetical protein PCC7424_4522 [Gloeothece citriformis PCC 7424]|uniref:Uncharacterized protein n=1 Tax=Gloeothece citriformis (strain PCC 7424) TaxID=65393 RepID=B7KAB1_GLOC7|nr:hypothetical protein [Gloeothece citriformis]ACK72885.1 hypothetical protein PCC7424_4522 [Gloeothece citriformis PCC 7424]
MIRAIVPRELRLEKFGKIRGIDEFYENYQKQNLRKNLFIIVSIDEGLQSIIDRDTNLNVVAKITSTVRYFFPFTKK